MKADKINRIRYTRWKAQMWWKITEMRSRGKWLGKRKRQTESLKSKLFSKIGKGKKQLSLLYNIKRNTARMAEMSCKRDNS